MAAVDIIDQVDTLARLYNVIDKSGSTAIIRLFKLFLSSPPKMLELLNKLTGTQGTEVSDDHPSKGRSHGGDLASQQGNLSLKEEQSRSEALLQASIGMFHHDEFFFRFYYLHAFTQSWPTSFMRLL